MKSSTPRTVPTIADASAVETPTKTHYDLMAAALMQALRDFIASVPAFEVPDPAAVEAVRKRTYLPAAFVNEGVDAIIVSEELQAIPQLEADATRDDRQYVEAFRPLVREMVKATRGLQFNVSLREARLGERAAQAYAVSKALLRQRSGAGLAVRVEAMRRARARRKTRNEEPAPGPAGGEAPKA